MSFIISDKQHLASSGKSSNYQPFAINEVGCKNVKLDVNFGHPLYTSVFGISAVECTAARPVVFPVVPNGCISMVFYGQEEEMEGKLCGTIDEIKKIELKPGELLLTMHFQPSSTVSFLKESASSLTNKVYDIKDYLKNGGQILSAASRDLPVQDKAVLLSKLIRIRMSKDDSSYLIKYCTERIFEKHGNIKVSELGTETGYSERYLGKIFEKYVGLSPKIYCEIMRLQNSLGKLMGESSQEPLINMALDSGFFDHAHMNRCFKRFLHCSSGTLRKCGFSCLDYDKINPYLNE